MIPRIKIERLSKKYNNNYILKDINLSINKREIISIIGPSGVGKTTLLKIISGLIKAEEGQIKVNDIDINNIKEERMTGYIFQAPTLLPWRNTIENVALAQEILNTKSKDEIKEIARKNLALVGLDDYELFYPKELSGGMQQRVAIARALSFNPKILLMDEPFSALDEITREKMNELILDIWDKNILNNIFLVTHSITDAVYLSNKVIVINGTPGKIKSIIKINLPKKRTIKIKDSKRFKELVECLKQKL